MHIDLEWKIDNRDAWEHQFALAPKSNLLQSWAYGEAKARIEGLSVDRAVFRRNGEIVALMQVLIKRVAAIAIMRINRGPIWLVEPDQETARLCLRTLRNHIRWWQGRALFIAPEVTVDAAAMLGQLGYRRRTAPAWRSVWLDLQQPEDNLRKGLEGRWRNMLKAGERAGVAVSADTDDAAYAWLVDRYKTLMVDREFVGIPIAILDELRRLRRRADDVLIYRARHGESVLAGACVVRHGTTATYLVGWSGEEGRRLRAMNVVLFEALRDLSRRGCAWFDLGGIDEALTPGITRFKRGLGGEEYELAGEFWSI